jgi:DNA-binding CsgD family transcriptional regulator
MVDEKLVQLAQRPLPRITAKEQQFLGWCCTELTYKEIADRMGISPRTAESYADTLCGKLGVKSRIGLVMVALQMGAWPMEAG